MLLNIRFIQAGHVACTNIPRHIIYILKYLYNIGKVSPFYSHGIQIQSPPTILSRIQPALGGDIHKCIHTHTTKRCTIYNNLKYNNLHLYLTLSPRYSLRRRTAVTLLAHPHTRTPIPIRSAIAQKHVYVYGSVRHRPADGIHGDGREKPRTAHATVRQHDFISSQSITTAPPGSCHAVSCESTL